MIQYAISNTGVDLIKKFEGLRLKSYLCPAGKVTVGWGHTGAFDKVGVAISIEQAEKFLADDIEFFAKGVRRAVGDIRLNSNQFATLVAFAFNIGLAKFSRSTLVKRVKENRLDAVPSELMRWTKAGGVELKGLVARRKAESSLWSGK